MNNRRTFLRQSAAAASALSFPLIGGAQPKAVKVEALAVSALQPRDQPTTPSTPAADPWATSAPGTDEPPF